MKPIKLVSEKSKEFQCGMDQVICEQVRKEIRPLIFIIRVICNVYVPICALFMAIGCFYVQDTDYVTTWKLFPIIFWSIIFSIMFFQAFYCQGAAVLTLVINSRLLILAIRNIPKAFQIMDSSAAREKLWKHVSELLDLITKVRKYNQTMKSVIGCIMFFYYLDSTIIAYVMVSPTTPIEMVLPCGTAGPIYFSVLCLFIIISARVHENIQESMLNLIAISPNIDLNIEERIKINSIFEGMKHQTAFDGSDFVPQLHSSLVIWVNTN